MEALTCCFSAMPDCLTPSMLPPWQSQTPPLKLRDHNKLSSISYLGHGKQECGWWYLVPKSRRSEVPVLQYLLSFWEALHDGASTKRIQHKALTLWGHIIGSLWGSLEYFKFPWTAIVTPSGSKAKPQILNSSRPSNSFSLNIYYLYHILKL